AAAEGIIGAAVEPIVLSRRESLADHQGGRRNPTALVKLRQSIRALQGDVTHRESGGVLSRARFVKTEPRNEAEGEPVDQAILDVRLVTDVVCRAGASQCPVSIEVSVSDQVVQIGLEQPVALR